MKAELLTPAERAQMALQDAAPLTPDQAWWRGVFLQMQTLNTKLDRMIELLEARAEPETPKALFESQRRGKRR